MNKQSANDYIGRSALRDMIASSIRFEGLQDGIASTDIRYPEILSLIKAIGIKGKTQWLAKRTDILESLLSNMAILDGIDGSSVLQIQIGDDKPILTITITDRADQLMNELQLGLKWNLTDDKLAKQKLDEIQAQRYSAMHAQQCQVREQRGLQIRADVANLRRGIRSILPLFGAHVWPLMEIDRLKDDLEAVRELQDKLSKTRERRGHVDRIIDLILWDSDLSINDIPELLSPSGCLIDSDICLGVLQVRNDYRAISHQTTRSLNYELISGYRPHTDLIKQLPRHFYDHPGYLAPAEDLLDWLAVDFYAASRVGDAEDGAIGWLLHVITERSSSQNDILKVLASESQYWSEDRLLACLKCWDTIVNPALFSRPH